MKHALIVRHTPFEGAAGFRQPIEQAGYRFARINVSDPEFATFDWLDPDLVVVMGGPMGVYQRDLHPWIDGEITGLALRIAAGRATLGVCLGSQLIAAALGSRVYPGPIREVGFAPVALSETGARSPLRHLVGVPVLHWHGDTFELPEGAELLATTHAFDQAFRIGDSLLALQFHPEMGEDPRFAEWLNDETYIAEAGTDPHSLRADHDRLGPAAVAAGRLMLAEWLAQLPDAYD
ncbi:glutamine amidotransferase [Sphingomonas crusticola]|uniref:glutamine amidotransferase n=1 Tax=Sphingomonas crusticola TaxID=1697973 RepID=UPI000E2262DD|nr:glutamine amidotransferase [Sphingomonas crusticola]